MVKIMKSATMKITRSIVKNVMKSWRHARNGHRSGNFAATEVWFCKSKWLSRRHLRGTKPPNAGVFSEGRSDLAWNIHAACYALCLYVEMSRY
jgi:hypothetical protein